MKAFTKTKYEGPEKIPEAINYIEAMRTKGKVAMVWRDTEAST